MHCLVILLAILGLVSTVLSAGVSLTNNFAFPFYYIKAGFRVASETIEILPTQTIDLPPEGQISLKFFKHPGPMGDQDPIMQFEYTFNPVTGQVAWDCSHVDGDGPGHPGPSPFRDENVLFVPLGGGSIATFPTCEPVVCRAGVLCEQSYQFPKDDKKTNTCSDQTTLHVIFGASDAQMHMKRGIGFSA